MKIAFTHNLKVGSSEEEAEFDTAETIDALASELRGLGHDVHLVEVSGPASRLVARLESLNPDLVFNTAEGWHGRYREAFYPALFEQLRLPFTGSDAYVCALTLDKQATKLMVRSHGVQTPNWAFFDRDREYEQPDLRFPVIAKPNFEGSSKGVTKDSIVNDPDRLKEVVEDLLARYPEGILVEEFIVGLDCTVPYLALAETPANGVLEPASYRFGASSDGMAIYDYELKNELSDQVEVDVPARVPPAAREKMIEATRRVVTSLGIHDLGRCDFRVTDDGEVYFIEVNALPSLEPGASIYEASKRFGLTTVQAVLDKVIQSAIERQNIVARTRPSHALQVGLTYNLKRVDPRSGNDEDAEFDAPTTIEALASAIRSLGHDVVLLEATAELPKVLAGTELDVVFNIAEGLRGRNRESQVPALLELLGIEYTGSDPAALSITLDKGLAKRIVREAGVPTPRAAVATSTDFNPDFRYPLIVKPNAEGSSKGITSASVVHYPDELKRALEAYSMKYRSNALIEEFLPGREFTVAVLGELEPRILPPMEIVFGDAAGDTPVYSFGHKIETEQGVSFACPADIDADLLEQIQRVVIDSYKALGCRDVARIDVRCDAQGVPNFIECNPLPGLTPDFSDLCVIAKAAGMDYTSLIGEILTPAVRRLYANRESQIEN